MEEQLRYQFGARINNKGFVMPTVMGFIIISSMVILYQSIAMVTELYSLKAAEQDLYLTNYIVNTRRVVRELDIGDICSLKSELSYQTKDQFYKMETNCIYTEVANDQYNEIIYTLLTTPEISKSKFEELYKYLTNSKSEVINNKVKLSVDGELLEYQDKLYISIIEYGSNKVNKILITDSDGNVINNINVKSK